jgi:hypothetical protein
VHFLERLDAWTEWEDPPDELRIHVTRWLFTRADDPLTDAKRVAGFEDLWIAVVPDSTHQGDRVVVCSYWLDQEQRTAQCDQFGSLTLPLSE